MPEMKTYEVRDEYDSWTIEAVDDEAAIAQVKADVEPSNPDENGEVSTEWFDFSLYRIGDDGKVVEDESFAGFRVTLDPVEPDCVDGKEHDWSDDWEIVGGIKENPGVWGHGGGITSDEACLRCAMRKQYDSWASNGAEQGLKALRYRPHHFREAVARYHVENDQYVLSNTADSDLYEGNLGECYERAARWTGLTVEQLKTQLEDENRYADDSPTVLAATKDYCGIRMSRAVKARA